MLLDHILLLLLCISYGVFFAIGKFALQAAAPVFFTGTRMLLAGIVLLTYYYVVNKTKLKLTKQQWAYLLAISIFGIYLTNVSEFWGLQYISTGKASLLCSFYPIITAVISWAWLREVISKKQILGLLIGMLGFFPVLLGKDAIVDTSGAIGIFTYAELAMFTSSVALALGWLFVRQAVHCIKIDVIALNGISMLIGGFLAIFHSYRFEAWEPFPITDISQYLWTLVIILLTSNILSYNLHSYLLKKFTATYIAFVTLLIPIFSSFFGWLIWNEVLTYNFWISTICIGIGLSIYYKENLKVTE